MLLLAIVGNRGSCLVRIILARFGFDVGFIRWRLVEGGRVFFGIFISTEAIAGVGGR
jgi:hypothetical protein